jgi:hypothetical protein
MRKIYKHEISVLQNMIGSIWHEFGLNRDRQLSMTDFHKLKEVNNLVKASEKKLELLQQKAKGNTDEEAQEKVILEASRQLEETLEDLIMFFETR